MIEKNSDGLPGKKRKARLGLVVRDQSFNNLRAIYSAENSVGLFFSPFDVDHFIL